MSQDPNTFDTELLHILICPLTRTPLIYQADTQELISEAARKAFPIREGIPVMLPEEARSLD